MKIGTVIVALLVGTASMYFAIWMLKSQRGPEVPPRSPDSQKETATDAKTPGPDPASLEHKAEVDPAPVISPTGPHPKAVVEKPEADLGLVESGSKGQHTYIIRNEGQAPLVLARGGTTCKCTLSKTAREPIAPGQSGTIELELKPQGVGQKMRQTATILTNDPQHKSIELTLTATVEERLVVSPTDAWNLGNVSDDEPSTFTATVSSKTIDKFQIVGFESKNPLLSAEAIAFAADELKNQAVKSGYSVRITLKPGMPVGQFSLPLLIKTDVPAPTEDKDVPGEPIQLHVTIAGARRGPITIFGSSWVDEHMTVTLGSFAAAEGAKVALSMFVRNAPEEGLKFVDVKSAPEYLKWTLEQDLKFKGKAQQRYVLSFEFPAGTPRDRRLNEKPAIIKVRTNHPQMPEMTFRVVYNAY